MTPPVRKGPLKPLPRKTVEAWLLSSGLAERDDQGELRLTGRGNTIAGALIRLG